MIFVYSFSQLKIRNEVEVPDLVEDERPPPELSSDEDMGLDYTKLNWFQTFESW